MIFEDWEDETKAMNEYIDNIMDDVEKEIDGILIVVFLARSYSDLRLSHVESFSSFALENMIENNMFDDFGFSEIIDYSALTKYLALVGVFADVHGFENDDIQLWFMTKVCNQTQIDWKKTEMWEKYKQRKDDEAMIVTGKHQPTPDI